jgi:excisionase family DNA binding protein
MRIRSSSEDARIRTASVSRQITRGPQPVPSRRPVYSDHPSSILLCDDTAAAPEAELAAAKGFNPGRKSRQRNLSICLNDLPPFMTNSSIPLPAKRGVGNQQQDRRPAGSIGSPDAVDQTAGPPAPDESFLLDSREVERLLGIGRTKVYELIAREQIPVVRIGRSVRIPRDQLRTWIEQRTAPRISPDARRQDS